MEIKTLDEYNELIRQWSEARGIIENGRPMSQAIKSLEEVTELLDAINTNDIEATIDAVGDVFVTLCNVCFTSGLDINECVSSAYNEIKDRTGYLRADGTFVKDSK